MITIDKINECQLKWQETDIRKKILWNFYETLNNKARKQINSILELVFEKY